MRHSIKLTLMIGAAAAALMMVAADRGYSQSNDPNAAPNPYKMLASWAQLGEGGRLVYVQRHDGVGRATLATRIDGTVSSRISFEAAVPPLPGFRAPAGFVF